MVVKFGRFGKFLACSAYPECKTTKAISTGVKCPKACGGDVTSSEMEALVRNVIVHRGLPFAMLSVAASPAGWNVQVRAETGGIVSFAVSDDRPVAMRVAIQERLEAEL